MAGVGTNERLKLSLPRDTRYLFLVRRAVAAVAERSGFDPTQIAQIEMAVDEACANAILHADAEAAAAPVEIEISLQGDELVVAVADRNEAIVRAQTPRCPEPCTGWWEREGRGGLGLPIMQRFMDEVRVATGDGNRVEMRRRVGSR